MLGTDQHVDPSARGDEHPLVDDLGRPGHVVPVDGDHGTAADAHTAAVPWSVLTTRMRASSPDAAVTRASAPAPLRVCCPA